MFFATDTSDFWCGRIVARFSPDCASTHAYRSELFEPLIQKLRKSKRYQVGTKVWADRAFTFDLNGEGVVESFIAVSCGATGNCMWAVLAGSPPQEIATINADTIYIHELQDGSAWSVITAYAREGVTAGVVEQFDRSAADRSYKSMGVVPVSWVVHDAFLVGMGSPTCGK